MNSRREALSQGGPVRKFGYRLLLALTRTSYRHPWVVLLLGLVLCLTSVAAAVNQLSVRADISSLLPAADPARDLDKAMQAEFPGGGDLVVVVHGGRISEREEFVESFSARLRQHPSIYADVFARMDLEFFRRRLLYYLTVADLRLLVKNLEPAVKWMSRPSLNALPSSGQGAANKTVLQVVERIARDYQETLDSRGEKPYESLWKSAVMEKAPTPELKQRLVQLLGPGRYLYNTSPYSEDHVILIRPAADVAFALKHLRGEIARVTAGYHVLEVGVTGVPALAQDEMNHASTAARRSLLISGVLVAFLFAISFASRWRAWIMAACLLIGLGWTAGYLAWTLGSLQLLGLVAVPLVAALGAGFGIHIMYGYEDQRARVPHPLEAMEICMQRAGMHVFAAALITSVAFATVALTGSQALTDFAVLATGGVMLCFLAMVTVLPAWLFLQERYGRRVRYRPGWSIWLKSHEVYWLERPGLTLALGTLFTVICLFYLRYLQFDHNLLNLQHRGIQMERAEGRLLAEQANVLPAQSLAVTVEEARQKSAAFSRLGSVGKVESPVSLLPENAEMKSPLIRQVARLAAQLRVPSQPTMGAVAMQTNLAAAKSTLKRMGAAPAARAVLDVLTYAEETAYQAGPGPVVDSVQLYFGNLKADVEGALSLLRRQSPRPVTIDQLPKPLRLRSVGRTGKILVQVYPKESPWDYAARQHFVEQVKQVDPGVTGLPVQLEHVTEVLLQALKESAALAGLTIFLALLVYFGSLWKTMLVFIPQALGLIWMMGMMVMFEVSFNPVNFLALPIIMAVGGVLGLHIVQRLSQDPKGGVLRHPIGAAMALSGLTGMAMFGSLMTADHQGIRSLGFVLTVGVATNLVSTLVAMPALTRILARRWGPFFFEKALEAKRPMQLA